jgi:putative phage-type endonuclease
MSHVYLSDLEDLKDIINSLVFEDEPSIFTEEFALQLVETALHLMEEFMIHNPTIISEPDFHEILLEEIKDFFYIQMEDHIEGLDSGDDIEEDMNELLQDAFQIFITLFHPERSITTSQINEIELCSEHITKLEQKIQGLRNIPQPTQRTPEWYEFRSNLITASNAWKAFESQAAINQLIYEKCQPIKPVAKDDDVKVINNVNTNTAMHHGQKYEPISVMLYESIYKTKVEDFGCIQHPTYKFLGASPDGIIVDQTSDRFGRMLEIKNPVSRDITGIPKKEYWVQMQLQMEVCDLDECDFLETKFVEYPDSKSYKHDNPDGKQKGVIIQFYTKECAPFYSYKPLHLKTDEEVLQWEDETITLYESEPYNYTYTKYIYWKLEKISCVLVLRNRDWFKNNIGQLENVWKIVEKERVTGYEHRAPNRKIKTDSLKSYIEPESKGCQLLIKKNIN